MKPKLKPDVIYVGDNGRLLCLNCAGASAKFSGYDLSGRKVRPVPRQDTVAWKKEFGVDLTCEGGCTTYPQPTAGPRAVPCAQHEESTPALRAADSPRS